MLSCTFVSRCRQSVRAPVERLLFIALLAYAGIFQPADEAHATAAEIMTRPAMGAGEEDYQLATLPLRYYIVDPYPGNRDWQIWTAPAPPEPYPAFARQMPGTEDGVLFENDDVVVKRRDQAYWWPAGLSFISPDGDVSNWGEHFLVQNHGTQQQELRAAG